MTESKRIVACDFCGQEYKFDPDVEDYRCDDCGEIIDPTEDAE